VLQRIGRVAQAEALVRPMLECAQPFGYRNKMAFAYALQTMAPSPAGWCPALCNTGPPAEYATHLAQHACIQRVGPGLQRHAAMVVQPLAAEMQISLHEK
jgi:hypothetical protein